MLRSKGMERLICQKDGTCIRVHCEGASYTLNYRLDHPKNPPTRIYHPKEGKRLLRASEGVNHREKLCEVWDQGKLGSCTAQTIAATLMMCMCHEKFTPSRLFIYYCSRALAKISPGEDSGCTMYDACRAIATYGFCREELMPYSEDGHTAFPPLVAFQEATSRTNYIYESIRLNLNDLTSVLDEGFCFIIGIAVYESLFDKEVVSSGNIRMPQTQRENLLGGHAITICGYDRRNRIFHVRNSWGQKWGNKGYGTIPFDYLTNPNLAMDAFVLRCKSHH